MKNFKTWKEAATYVLAETLSFFPNRKRFKWCTVVDSEVYKKIIRNFPKVITVGKKKWTVKKEFYTNPNTRNKVVECTCTQR